MIDTPVTLEIQPFTQADWTDTVRSFRDLSILQTWAYGAAKVQGGWVVERGLFRRDRVVVGAVQAMVRKIPFGGVAWVNRGPLWRPADGTAVPDGRLDAVFTAMRDHWVKSRGLYLRVAPMLDEGGAVLASGFRTTDRLGWASATLDLTRTLDELRAGLKGKWRGHLSKAERSGLVWEYGTSDAMFETFLDAHKEFLTERGFATTLTPGVLRAMQAALPEERKMVIFLGQSDGTLAGSILIARYGDTAEYLAANLSPVGRKKNFGQFLVWRAVEMMKAEGYKTFDLSGLDSDRTPAGIRDFKEGLGAEPYRLTREVEALAGPGSRLVKWRVDRALGLADGGSA